MKPYLLRNLALSLTVTAFVCFQPVRALAAANLTLGNAYSGTISLAGQHDTFTFTGTAGQRLYYDALDADNDAINVQLISPSGAIPYINGNSDSDVGPFTLTETGNYTLVQFGSGDYTNDYSFRLIDVSQSPAKALTFDTTVNGTNALVTAASVYRFTGTNGQRLYFDFAATNIGSASVNLYGTQNQGLNSGGLASDFEQTLPADGTYFLVIGNSTDASATNFSFRIVTPNTTTNALTLGATVTGSLDEPGEEDRFTFTGTVGQRLYYDALDADNDAINAQLISPSGGIGLINGNSDTDVGLFTLTESGTYTLLQKATGDYTNDYSFRLLDLAAATLITNGVAVTNTLNPQTSARLYRINGTAGQRIGITNLAASSGNANWSLVRPDDAAMLSDNILNNLGEVTLPTTGTYGLLVVGNVNFIGGLDYQFRVSLVSSASGGTSGFGTVRSGDTIFDQTNAYSYTAPAGLPVYFDALTNTSPVTVRLVAPSGYEVFAVNGGADAGPYFLPESGSYTLNVIGTADGSFDFRLLNLNVDATNLVFGTAYNPTLSPAFRTDIYRFTGTNGQRLDYDALEFDGDAVAVQLINPSGGIVFINGNSDNDVGPFTLTQAGTYYLTLISQLADDAADYNFRLIDVAQLPAKALTFDTTVTGTNELLLSESVYRFTGTNGQRLFFDFAATNIGVAYVYLYGPQNQNPYGYGGGLTADFEQKLTADGTYVLTIGNYSAGDAATNFSFRVVTPNTTTNVLTLGATVTGSLDEPGEEDRYTFSGTAGQRLYYDALEYDGDAITVQLISPSGAIPFVNGNSDTDVGPFTLTETGTYTLLQKGNGDYTNDYSFRLIDVAQLPAKAFTFDTTVNGTNAPVTAASVYRFTGTNGQRLYFDFAATNLGVAYVYVYGPQNQQLNGYVGALTTDFEQKLPADGSYVLTIGNNNDPLTTNFSFRIVTPNTTTNALTLGATVTGSLDEPGEEDRFTFTGTAGQRLYYDALDAGGDPINVQLISPSGAIPFINGNSDTDLGPFTLTETGTYTLLLKAGGDNTGDYSFRLIDVAQLPAKAFTFDTTVNGTNALVTAASVYRFTGTNGQRLYFDFAATNLGIAFVALYGPQNVSQYGPNGNYLYTDFEQKLTADGTYVLTIGNYNAGDAATNFSFRVVTPNTTTNALTLGATVTGSLDEPGEEDRFTFTGTVGQRLYYDALDADNDAINAQLISPSGGIGLINGNSDTDVGLFTLTESGTYTLLQKATGDYTNDYSFRLLDLAAATLITNGVAVTNTLNPQTSARLYRINGTAGQRIGITNLAASSGNANWSLVRPDDAAMLSDNILNNLGEVTLPTTGTYGLLVVGNVNFIGGLDYQFRVSLVSSASGGTSGFGTVRSGNTIFDQTNAYSYTAPAGLPVYFDALTNTSPVTVQMVAPGGSLVFNINGGADAGPYFLPESGSYTLNVIGTADGSFDFRLLNLNVDATNLVFGTAYNPTLSPAFRTDVYRFTGTNGQRLYYDALDNDYDAVSVQLFNPSGAIVFLNDNADSDVGPFTLTQAGTYYLAILSQLADATADYNFRLIDAAQAPAQSLILDATISSTLNLGLGVDIYRVVGSAGQRLYFDGASTNEYPVGYWLLFGTENQGLSGNWISGDFEVTLPETGTNLLFVYRYYNDSTNPVPYSFRVVTPNTTTNALTLGATVTGSLDEAGEEDRFTFTGTAGQRLYYDALDADNDAINVQLISPSGAIPFINGNSDTDVGPFTLTETGTYTLLLKAGGDNTGDYSFRILDVAVQPFVSLDATNSGSVTLGTAAQLLQFNSVAHLRLYFDDLGSLPPGYGIWTPYNPINVPLGGNNIGSDFELVDPALTATYLLVFNSGYTNDYNYTFRIVPGNHAPVLAAIASRTNNELVALTFTNTATDLEADNDQLTFTLDAGAPTGAAINPLTGVFTWTPTEAQGPGIYPVTVRVTDDGVPSFNDSKSFSVTVNEVNVAPVLFVPANTNINELATLTVTNTATDSDIPANALTFSLVSPLTGMAINATNGVFTWTPTEAQGPSTNTITVVVTDTNAPAVNSKSLSTTNTFSVVVNELNVAPVLNFAGNTNINEQTQLTVTNTATDADIPANALTFSLVSPLTGMAINATNGVFTWTPTEAQGPSTNTITVVVTDTNAPAANTKTLSATNTFTVVVNEVNVAPVLTVPANTNINELATLTVTNIATDADIPANALTFSLVSPLTGMAINATNGVFTWTPTEVQGPSTNTITVVVTDTNALAINAKSLSATNSFTVTVNEVNVAPLLTLPPNSTNNELVAYAATATATDADVPTNALTFALVSGPTGLTVSTAGAINWTPTENQGPSTNVVSIRVTDTNPPAINTTSISVTNNYTIVISEVNVAPTLPSLSNITNNEGATLTITNTASDTDVPTNTLTYTLLTAPGAASISANGVISWVTTEADGPSTNTFKTKVTDNGSPALSATNTFLVVINEVNVAPVVGALGNYTVNPGLTISFTATATDADVPTNTLSFSLVSPPTGASIIAGSGAFNWRPTVAQADTTNIVKVKVLDNGSPNLSDTNAFTVIVNPLAPVILTPIAYTNGSFNIRIIGTTGPDYVIMASTDLFQWSDLFTNLSPATPFTYIHLNAGSTNRFYRVKLSP